jgi:hypothetical protein
MMAAFTCASAVCVGLFVGIISLHRGTHRRPAELLAGLAATEMVLAIAGSVAFVGFARLPVGLAGRPAARIAAATAVVHAVLVVVLTILGWSFPPRRGEGDGLRFLLGFDGKLGSVSLLLFALATWQLARAMRVPTNTWVNAAVGATAFGTMVVSTVGPHALRQNMFFTVLDIGVPLTVAFALCLPLERRLRVAPAPPESIAFEHAVPVLPELTRALRPFVTVLGGKLAWGAYASIGALFQLTYRSVTEPAQVFVFLAAADGALFAVLLAGWWPLWHRHGRGLGITLVLATLLGDALLIGGATAGAPAVGLVLSGLIGLWALDRFRAAVQRGLDEAGLPSPASFTQRSRAMLLALGIVVVAVALAPRAAAASAVFVLPAVVVGAIVFRRLLPSLLETERHADAALERQAVAIAREREGHVWGGQR